MADGTANGNGTRRSWKESMFDWLFQQGVSTVLLFAILCAIGYALQYAMTTAIPQHIQSINQGNKAIAQECKEAVTLQAKECKEAVSQQAKEQKEAIQAIVLEHSKDRESYERWKERLLDIKLNKGLKADGSQ